MTITTARRLGVVAALASLVLGSAAVAYADEPDLTVTGRVVDGTGAGLAGISVYAISDADLAKLQSDDDEDDFDEWSIVTLRTAPSGRFSLTDGRFTQAGWNFAFVDERKVSRPFALTETHTTLTAPTTDLGDTALKPGAIIAGTITTAVTGTPVRGAEVLLSDGTSFSDPDDIVDYRDSSRAGRFVFRGLAAQTYGVWLLYSESERFPSKPALAATVTEGQIVDKALTVRVPCRRSFSATSTSKGKVTFRASASAPANGITSPRGKVTIRRHGKVVKTLTFPRTGHTVTATVKQAKGRKGYTATYTAGDCASWKIQRTVTVRG